MALGLLATRSPHAPADHLPGRLRGSIQSSNSMDCSNEPHSCHHEQMDVFGETLKGLRKRHGLRQADLVARLDGVIARSTLANIEAGRENPSPRLWEAICRLSPEWVAELEPHYRNRYQLTSPRFEVSGPFEVEQAHYVYNFREHEAPEEIIQVRRLRALEAADGYGLRLSHHSDRLALDTEALLGGWIQQHETLTGAGESLHLTRFHFDHQLQRGDVHTFATRSWASDHEPARVVTMTFTRACREAVITLNFYSERRRPSQVWQFGPLADPQLEPEDGVGQQPLPAQAPGSWTMRVAEPRLGHIYGVGWAW